MPAFVPSLLRITSPTFLLYLLLKRLSSFLDRCILKNQSDFFSLWLLSLTRNHFLLSGKYHDVSIDT